MKTVMQKNFEKNIIKSISYYANSPQHCSDLMIRFIDQSELYYDFLCSNIYKMSSSPSKNSLWFQPQGHIYLSSSQEKSHDLRLISADEIAPFDGDIIQYVQICCKRMEEFGTRLAYGNNLAKSRSC